MGSGGCGEGRTDGRAGGRSDCSTSVCIGDSNYLFVLGPVGYCNSLKRSSNSDQIKNVKGLFWQVKGDTCVI